MLARRLLYGMLALVVLGLPLITLTQVPAASADDPAAVGQWSPPFDLGTIGIHNVLLPSGRVLLFQRAEPLGGTQARVWDPLGGGPYGATTDVSLGEDRDVFCAGTTLLSDGRLLVVGGHQPYGPLGGGSQNTNLFDPATQTWTDGPDMAEVRWYPTSIELGSGKVLVFGGQHERKQYATTVESYDPATGAMTQLPDSATRNVALYPRMIQLTDGRLFMAGASTRTAYFDPATNSWTAGPKTVYGNRNYGNAVLLPGLNKVLIAGGAAGNQTKNTAEIIDLSAPTPAWRATTPMNHARKYANPVLLPDGTLLEVAGGQTSEYGIPVETPEVFDPAAQTWTDMAPQTAPRQYHSTAILLPDGRVFSAGQDKYNPYAYTGELYSPPYLFGGARPTIAAAPSSVTYGQQFTITTPNAASIARVALIKLGETTHADNFDQRYLDVPFTQGDGSLVGTAPVDGNHAPPGWYMLFVVDGSGVPSVASMVHVGTDLTPAYPQAPRAQTWEPARARLSMASAAREAAARSGLPLEAVLPEGAGGKYGLRSTGGSKNSVTARASAALLLFSCHSGLPGA